MLEGEGANNGKRATERKGAGGRLWGRVQSEGRGAARAEKLLLRQRAAKTAHTIAIGTAIGSECD